MQAEIEASLAGEHGPWRWERCTHVDAAGFRNAITLGYWRRREDYLSWRQSAAVRVWSDRQHGVGYWIETLSCPLPQMETSYSTPEPNWGLAPQCPVELDPNHGYFGAMRDRIPAAEDGGLPATLTALPPEDVQQPAAPRLVVELPGNLCFIRTVQGWQDCAVAQGEDFTTRMLPLYRDGVAYLRDHPRTSRCISVRLVDMVDQAGQIQTQTLAWFLGLEFLERWAQEHPTHHAILAGMAAFAERHGMDLQVVLGHEVYVVPAGHAQAEYSGCHWGTGFLRFFPGRAV